MKIEIEQQVLDFVGSLAPEPRRLIREALRNSNRKRAISGRSRASLKASTGCVSGVTGSFSVTGANGRSRRIRCVYAAHRTLIYEVFAQEFHDLLEG
jgi:hypothetical protein